jgi:lysophospholipase L1-like esterase
MKASIFMNPMMRKCRVIALVMMFFTHGVLADLALKKVRAFPGKGVSLTTKVIDGTLEISCSVNEPKDLKYSAKTRRSGHAGASMKDLGLDSKNSKGISFEVRGDTPDEYASLFVGRRDKLIGAFGYELGFSVSSKWKKVTIAWGDLVQNRKPWARGPKGDLAVENQRLTADKALSVGWGRTHHYNNFDRKNWTLSIRNVQILRGPVEKLAAFQGEGLKHSLRKLKEKQPLKILLLGDSITDYGDDRSHFFFCSQLLKETHGSDSEIVNAGIGGHSVRGGTIVLDRSLKWMPNPDLVVVMFGANDCKASTTVGLTPADFQKQCVFLMDQLNAKIANSFDVLWLSGVPRLEKKQLKTTGVVESISDGIKNAAQSRNTAFIDSLSWYLGMDPNERRALYKDTVHQNESGLKFLGKLTFEAIQSQLN